MSITVLKPGLQSSVQDRGRCGFAGLGVGRAGPMDDVAHRLANALVGNDDDAAALEITLLGPQLRFEHAAVIALTGAHFPARIDAHDVPGWQAIHVAAGAVLHVGRAVSGARATLAVAGGIDAARVLGSASTDLHAGIGPFAGRALREGDVLTIAAPSRAVTPAAAYEANARSRHPATPLRSRASEGAWSLDPRPWFDGDTTHPIHLIRGRHFDSLDDRSRSALFDTPFVIGVESNRTGFRLDGAPLALRAPEETISEPVAFGTLQLPPSGQPIALMAEHPTIGGYPRIGQVAAIDLPRLAQRRPGEPLRIIEIGLDEAQTRYLERERALQLLLAAIAQRRAHDDR